ncbi:DUF4136 domain-containing protein [Paucibacter soli]|uniref:DUF4136 domain-containing protein n=1 Tax=Paucibacter soli TaxID=3133433 RepID=UPI0030A2C00B
MTATRRTALIIITAAAALAACSGIYTLSADVQTFGAWPEGRKPGLYAFERLPSQQGDKRQDALEDSARVALEKAGFRPAADAKSADILVTLGARVSALDRAPWDDPLWWRWHVGYANWRHGFWRGRGYAGLDLSEKRYDREVALLLRERASGEPLYEARASNDGMTQGDAALLGGLMQAALGDFPQTRPEVHRITVQLGAK